MNIRCLSIACILLMGPLACGDSGSSDDEGSSSDTSASGNPDSSSTDPSADTTGDPVDCGNDMIDGAEECDGTDLGGLTCMDVDQAFSGGDLACGATCTFDSSGCMVAPGTALVALNELTSDSIMEGFGSGRGDAIEIFNAGETAADLSGWRLCDDPAFPVEKTYVFPEGTMLAAGEFLVLIGQDEASMLGDYPFGISDSSNETIVLADVDGVVTDSVFVDGFDAVVSYCRVPDGTGAWAQCLQTFGAANELAEMACGDGVISPPEVCEQGDVAGATCDGLGLGFTGGRLSCTSGDCQLDVDGCTTTSEVVLNELESTNDDIEIYNDGDSEIDISGWIITDDAVDALYDDAADTEKLVFPEGTTIAAGDYLVVAAGNGAGQHPFGLSGEGDRVVLATLDPLTIIDQVQYDNNEAAVSFCRSPNGPSGGWMADCAATMGTENP